MQNRKTGIRYVKIRTTDLVFVILALFLFGFIAGIHYSPIEIAEEEHTIALPPITGERTVEMLLPAVDESGNGVSAMLITRVRPATPGYGMMLVSINDALAQYETQLSAKIAAKAAEMYTGADLTDFDIIYSIKVNASSVEGPSGGAAMAIAVVAALENKTIAKNVMITGTISEDGTIGSAGAVTEKIAAAKQSNITTFLVSSNAQFLHSYQKQKKCGTINKIEYCEITYAPKDNEAEELGVKIKKVDNLAQALEYFII